MARYLFGTDAHAWLVRRTVDGTLRTADGTVTAWTARTGGTRHTDLLTEAGEPADTIPATAGQYSFWGPDGVRHLWVDGGSERELIVGAEVWDELGDLLDNPFAGGLTVTDLGDGRHEITGTPSAPLVALGDGRYQIGA